VGEKIFTAPSQGGNRNPLIFVKKGYEPSQGGEEYEEETDSVNIMRQQFTPTTTHFIYLFILSHLTSFSQCGYVDKFQSIK
jgi:hypothetical protein